MANIDKNDEEKIWDQLYSEIQNPYGVAAVMGNLFAESSMNPLCLTGKNAKGLDPGFYVADIDSGLITKEEFAKDGIAFGLVQWLYHSRKADLYTYCKDNRISIGAYSAQIGNLLREIKKYKTVWNTITTTVSLKEASDIVMLRYERPGNTSDAAKAKRLKYAQQYFDKYKYRNSMRPTSAAIFETYEQALKDYEESKNMKSYVVTTSKNVFLRTGNDKKYTAVTRIGKEGTEFEWVATAENGWNAVKYPKNNAVYWISDEFSKVILK